jgi:uncharacterized protein
VSEPRVIAATKEGDVEALKSLLAGGGDANERDEQGWTALSWAAGRGDAAAALLLLAHGAQIGATGRDRRTPLMIAKAAKQDRVAELLAEAERQAGIWVDPRATRPYCRAYYLRDLRRFQGWSEGRVNWTEPAAHDGNGGGEIPLAGDDIVYLHQDFSVTKSMWHEESVIFARSSPEWKSFCELELGFAIPDDLL